MNLSVLNNTPLTFEERIPYCLHPLGKRLLKLMIEKESNLSLSADVKKASELLELTHLLGPHICVLKTHIDIIEDFTPELSRKLREASEKYQFLIFEDRKFADIGHTVQQQYEGGIYKIAEWAHLTNLHPLVGQGAIEALKQIALPRNNGILLIAELSVEGNLINQDYVQKSVELALKNPESVLGFICQNKLVDHPGFIHFTPGIQIAKESDLLGQRYKTPTSAILERGTDIVIVGRGITQSNDPKKVAEMYRSLSWDAYLQRSPKLA